MAQDETQQKIVQLLDVLSVEVGATRAGVERIEGRVERIEGRVERIERRIDELATETRAGFERVERRLSKLETRVEDVETESRSTVGRVSALEAGAT